MEIFPLGGLEQDGEVKIYFASVISVNESAKTCDIRISANRGFNLENVPYTAPSMSPDGSGIDFVPVSGSMCIVATELSNKRSPADNTCFILGFIPRVTDVEDRVPTAEGDVVISSPEGNRVEVRSDGSTRIMAHEECAIEMYPDSSRIETYCASKLIKTAGGTVEWLSDGDNESDATTFKAVLKTRATREVGSSRLFLFEAGDAGTPEVVAKILDPTDSEAPGRIVWSGNSDGDISLETSGSIASKYAGNLSIDAEIGAKLRSPSIRLDTDKSFIQLEGETTLIDTKELTIRADRIHMQSKSTDQVFFTTGTEDVLDTANKQLVTEDILGWLFNHVHPEAGLPPLGAPLVEAETMPVDEDAALALLVAEQAAAALFKVDQLAVVAGLKTALETLRTTQPQLMPVAQPLITILDILNELVEGQKRGYVQATTGGSGVLYSYGQVLTQDTKVR